MIAGLSLDNLAAMLAFVTVMSITPGPNNVIALTSGVNFGMSKTIPFTLGVGIGFASLLLAVASGLGEVLSRLPWAFLAIKIVGILYLLYLAFRIAMARDLGGDGHTRDTPMTFLESCWFQWLNPKGWTLAIGGVATYVPPSAFWIGVVAFSLMAFLLGLLSTALWAGFGVLVQNWLGSPGRIRAFNVAMAALLVLSLAPAIWSALR
jgi:threonine/homoserine/homoserine lactone efflux protein